MTRRGETEAENTQESRENPLGSLHLFHVEKVIDRTVSTLLHGLCVHVGHSIICFFNLKHFFGLVKSASSEPGFGSSTVKVSTRHPHPLYLHAPQIRVHLLQRNHD